MVSIERKSARCGDTLGAGSDFTTRGHRAVRVRCLATRARAAPSGARRALMVGALGRRHWIPPVALVAGQLAHGASWILLLVLALHRPFTLGAPALGWLHLIALGWLTMTALTILVHVIPGFTDATWRGERIARGALLVFEAAVIVLVFGFWSGATAVLPWAGTLIVLALA